MPGGKANLPVRHSLNLSGPFGVWVTVWVKSLTHILTHTEINCTQENGHDGFDPRPRLVDTHLTHRVRGTSSVIK